MSGSSFKHPDVLAVVVNWNAGDQLENCLRSLQHQCQVVVVDNDSTDGSDQVAEYFSGVTLVRAMSNLGFAKACNLGVKNLTAKNSSAKYLLFLNPDAVIDDGTLEKVLSNMHSDEYRHVGICGVQLIDDSGKVARSCARHPSFGQMICHSIGIDRFFPRTGFLMTDWAHNRTQYVDHVIGAFYFVRRDVFTQLDGFDEHFFLYYEDLDFSKRAKNNGWESLYLADARAYHKGGGTSNQIKAKRLFYALRARLQYSFKHFAHLSAGLVGLSTLLIEPLTRSMLALIKRSPADFSETWQAYAMLYRWIIGQCLKKVTR